MTSLYNIYLVPTNLALSQLLKSGSSNKISRLIVYHLKICFNKKVLLRERKRHTARCVANTRYVVLTGYPPGGGGYPVRYPPPGGVPHYVVLTGYVPRYVVLTGYPPGVPSQVPLGGGGPGTPRGVPGQVTPPGGSGYPRGVPGQVPPWRGSG